jgi:two-component system chemotaxis response regulator CheY
VENSSDATTVLLVDDVALLRTLVRRILEPDGRFEIVAEANDGDEAIARAAELQPDLILLDLMMPGRDGISAFREIRLVSPASRVVFLTGPAGEPRSAQHADLCLQKGLSGAEMIAALERLLALSYDP